MTYDEAIVDTFPTFLHAVEDQMPDTVDSWLELWTERYMTHWPELFEMQVADYAEQGDDWRQIARDMVFPGMSEKLPAIQDVYRRLKRIIPTIEERVRRTLDFRGQVLYVLYVGIGNGAGWVTTYDGRPAVLFGLEAIIDSGFDSQKILEGLVAHELGHVVHFSWREGGGQKLGSGPWWQLYEEGFAQYCEQQIMGDESWHMRAFNRGEDWLAWCTENKAWLASEYLRAVEEAESVRLFFGSWYHLRGHKQTGYFLGHETIDNLAHSMALTDIALLDEGEALAQVMRRVLNEFAAGTS
jgi:hypothetical protein